MFYLQSSILYWYSIELCCYWMLNRSFCDVLWNWNIFKCQDIIENSNKLSQPCLECFNVNLYQIAFPFSQNYDFYLSHQMFVCWRFYCQLFLMHFFLLLQRILYLRQNCFLESYYFSCWLPCALGWHPSWCEPFVYLSPAITIIININRKCNTFSPNTNLAVNLHHGDGVGLVVRRVGRHHGRQHQRHQWSGGLQIEIS